MGPLQLGVRPGGVAVLLRGSQRSPTTASSSSGVSLGRQLRLACDASRGGSSRGGGPARSPPRPGGYRPPGPGGGGGYRPGGPGGGGGQRFDRNGPREPRGPAVPMNENIRAPEVRVLNEDKEPLGVMSTQEALAMARDLDVDLILIVPDAVPPVARLIDYSKFNYEATKAVKEIKKKQRDSAIETKELKLRPATDVHDYQVKVRAAQKFLAKGARVKLTLQFKGREMEFKELGNQMFGRFVEDMGDIAQVEQQPTMQGRQMNMLLAPRKEAIIVAGAQQ